MFGWLFRRNQTPSAGVLRDRLQLVLEYDRAKLAPGKIKALEDALLAVMREHFPGHEGKVEVEQASGMLRMMVDMPLKLDGDVDPRALQPRGGYVAGSMASAAELSAEVNARAGVKDDGTSAGDDVRREPVAAAVQAEAPVTAADEVSAGEATRTGVIAVDTSAEIAGLNPDQAEADVPHPAARPATEG